MKKTIITIVITVILITVPGYFFLNMQLNRQKEKADLEYLHSVEKSVQKQIKELSSRIFYQVASLGNVIAAQQDFSLRILVENDRSSPDITEMASRYLKPMNFAVLDIADSSFTILSSGHFPASAGNSCREKGSRLSSNTVACPDNIMGTPKLTFQASSRFTIAGFKFYVMGGVVIDSTFLSDLTPGDNISLLLKNGNEYTGTIAVQSISEITGNHIIIDDRKYLAAVIELPSSGLPHTLELLLLVDK